MYLNHRQKIEVAVVLFLIVMVWEANGIYLAAFAHNHIVLYWLSYLFQWVILPTMLIILLAKQALILPQHYGFNSTVFSWQGFIAETIGMFISAGLAFKWSSQLSWHLLGQRTGYFNVLSAYPNGALHTVVWIYSSIAVGIVESIFFIGLPWLLYKNTQRHASVKVFSVLISVIFATTHWEQGPHVIVGAFFFSIVACYWYFKLGTLWPVAAGHALIDLVAFA
ncbi:CPBP family intramembrane glutamic endopeptidase [Crenothrix sp.]|uniref:CPBP family intramembrane glutamic endopeptidase n=1 Tax=Crenothrix sp. TaxID=3100433 RepID=UPI00374D434F